jgi:type I restriction enzyme S subunit
MRSGTRIGRLKDLCIGTPQYGLNMSSESYTDDGIRFVRTTDITADGRLTSEADGVRVPEILLSDDHRALPGDLLFSRSGTLGRCYRVRSQDRITFAGYLVRFRPSPSRADPRFLEYWSASKLVQDTIASEAITSTIANFNADRYSNLRVPVHPLDRQRHIADFLDGETASVDALVVAKQQMLSLGAVRMKSYVVDTLHGADLHPLKRQAALIDCKHRTPEYLPSGYPVVSPGDVTAGDLDLGRCHRFVAQADWEDLADGPRRPRMGDIVYSRNASVGLAALVRDGQQFCMGQDVCLVRTSRPDGDGRFLTHVLNTIGLDQIDAMKVGSTFFRVNVAQIAEIKIPAMSIPEQDDLVRRWDAERARLDGLASTLTAQIGLLRERRQALITAAVTGEIEV